MRLIRFRSRIADHGMGRHRGGGQPSELRRLTVLLKTSPDATLADRLVQLHAGLREIIAEYAPERGRG